MLEEPEPSIDRDGGTDVDGQLDVQTPQSDLSATLVGLEPETEKTLLLNKIQTIACANSTAVNPDGTVVELFEGPRNVTVVSVAGEHTKENSDVAKVVSPYGLEEGKSEALLWVLADGVTAGEIEKLHHSGRAAARIITEKMPEAFEKAYDVCQIDYNENARPTINDLATYENFIGWLEENANEPLAKLFLSHIRHNPKSFLRDVLEWKDVSRHFLQYGNYSPQQMAEEVLTENYQNDPVFAFFIGFNQALYEGADDFKNQYEKYLNDADKKIYGLTTFTAILETPTEFILINMGDSRSAAFNQKGECIASTLDTEVEYEKDGKTKTRPDYVGYILEKKTDEAKISFMPPQKIDIQRVKKPKNGKLTLASYSDGLSFHTGFDVVAMIIKENTGTPVRNVMSKFIQRALDYCKSKKWEHDDKTVVSQEYVSPSDSNPEAQS